MKTRIVYNQEEVIEYYSQEVEAETEAEAIQKGLEIGNRELDETEGIGCSRTTAEAKDQCLGI